MVFGVFFIKKKKKNEEIDAEIVQISLYCLIVIIMGLFALMIYPVWIRN